MVRAKIIYAITLVIILSTLGCNTKSTGIFNLGFEIQNDTDNLSDGWANWGNYPVSIDEESYTGSKSGKITSDANGSSYGSMAYKIPANYSGRNIRLDGYMKIKDVSDGFAGLLLRVDGNERPIVFDNMAKQNIDGTRDWQKYSIILDYPKNAKNIYVAGILKGKGEAWFDDFTLSIDGKNVQSIQNTKQDTPLALLDNEFDSGSNLKFNTWPPESINNLALLGKIWGFLKYHHPEIAKGNFNWDYELFRILAKLNNPKTNARDHILIEWIDSFGDIESNNTFDTVTSNAFIKPNIDWILELKPPLRDKLLTIYNGRNKGENYYVGMMPNIGNPNFENERSYSDMPFPDDGYRLLSLFRYWNIIHYYFPYKHLIDKNLEIVLQEYIPQFIDAKDELEYELVTLRLIGEIKDTHANLWGGANRINEWKGNNYAPFHVRFIEDQLVVTDYYNPELKGHADLEVGDVITSINGKTIEDILLEKSKFYPASNQAARRRDISSEIFRSKLDVAEVSYIQEELIGEKSTILQLYPKSMLNIYMWPPEKNNKSYKFINENIGYVTLQNINNDDIPVIWKEFDQTDGIIIDIRNYPSTFVPFKLGDMFISSPTPFVKFTKGSIDNPGEFTFTEELDLTGWGKAYEGKLIVLVNELTQSQAEYTAMAFRAGNNTTIIGSTTAGADGNVSSIFLPGGLTTRISGIGVYYPNGKETQRIGIVPNIEVHPTIQGIREGRDELIEKAIELINNED